MPVQFIMSLLPLAKCSASTWFLLQHSSAPQVKCKRVLQVLKQLLWESVLYRTAISGREPAVAFLSSVPWGRSLTERCPQHLLTCLERRVCVAALLQSVIHHGPHKVSVDVRGAVSSRADVKLLFEELALGAATFVHKANGKVFSPAASKCLAKY